jgi:hypothetical protein
MKPDPVEETIRARIHALAEKLPVDTASGWSKVVEQRGADRDEPVPAALKADRIRSLRGHRRPVLMGMVALAVVAGCAVGFVTFGAGPASGTPALPQPLPFTHGSHQQAVAILENTAALQERASSDSGTVRYAKTQNYALQTNVDRHASTTTIETTVRQVWVAPDGSATEKGWIQDTTRSGAPVGPAVAQSTDDHWQDINVGFPTSQTAIVPALLGTGATGNYRDLILAQSIALHLSLGTATPQQVAGLYRVLASLPGVFDAGIVTDNAGRTGRAVGILTGTFDAGRTCLPKGGAVSDVDAMLARNHALGEGITYFVLDPKTGKPLQIEALDTPNAPCGLHLPPGPIIEQYNVILGSGQVDRAGAQLP